MQYLEQKLLSNGRWWRTTESPSKTNMWVSNRFIACQKNAGTKFCYTVGKRTQPHLWDEMAQRLEWSIPPCSALIYSRINLYDLLPGIGIGTSKRVVCLWWQVFWPLLTTIQLGPPNKGCSIFAKRWINLFTTTKKYLSSVSIYYPLISNFVHVRTKVGTRLCGLHLAYCPTPKLI